VCIGMQLLRAAPILNAKNSAAHPIAVHVQQTELRLMHQLPEHARHGGGHRPPLVHGPELLDAHPNEEDHKVPFDPRRVTAFKKLRHTLSSMAAGTVYGAQGLPR